jgi:hypothetical protein
MRKKSPRLAGLGATVYAGDLGVHEVALAMYGSPRTMVRASLFIPTSKSRVHTVPQIQFMPPNDLASYSSIIDLDSRDLKLNHIPMWSNRTHRRTRTNALYFSLVNPGALLVRIDEVMANNPSFKGVERNEPEFTTYRVTVNRPSPQGPWPQELLFMYFKTERMLMLRLVASGAHILLEPTSIPPWLAGQTNFIQAHSNGTPINQGGSVNPSSAGMKLYMDVPEHERAQLTVWFEELMQDGRFGATKTPTLYRALQKNMGPVIRIVSEMEGNKPEVTEVGDGLLRRTRPNTDYKPNPFLDEEGNVPWDPQGFNMLYLREPERYDDLLGATDELRARAARGEPLLFDADGRNVRDELLDSRVFLVLDNQLYLAPWQFHETWWEVVDSNPALVQAVQRQDWRTVRVFIDEVLSRLKPLPPGTLVR